MTAQLDALLAAFAVHVRRDEAAVAVTARMAASAVIELRLRHRCPLCASQLHDDGRDAAICSGL
jgi:hypothetical protein